MNVMDSVPPAFISDVTPESVAVRLREVGAISDLAPQFPLAGGALAPLHLKAQAQGSGDFSPMWAGQAAALAREMPAGELTLRLAAEARELMVRMASQA